MAEAEMATEVPIAEPKRAGGWAWAICWLMFASTVLNYMDRQTITLVGDPIKAEFHLGNADFGWVMAAFALTYALFQVPAGYLVDRWNVRWTYAGAVGWWSLAALSASFSPSLGALMTLRALLGVGESFNWPCALRTTALVLPPKDRSLGNGIFNSGAAVGAVLTPLIVTPLAVRFGWRQAFLVVGVLGFVWVALWLIALGGERRHLLAQQPRNRTTPDEPSEPTASLPTEVRAAFGGVVLAAILVALSAVRFGPTAIWWGITLLMVGLLLAPLAFPLSKLKGADWALSLGEVVRLRRFWILVVVSVSINVCWHFLVNWLPTYLKEDRGMTFSTGGMLSAVPFLAADVGNLGGGALSRRLTRRGQAPVTGRLTVMTLCTFLITAGVWVGRVPNDAAVMVLLALMAMGTAAFMANYFAFAQDVSPRHTGLIVGILGGLGNLAAAGFLPFAGYVKDVSNSFAPIFVLVGLLPFLGLGALHLGWGRAEEPADPH